MPNNNTGKSTQTQATHPPNTRQLALATNASVSTATTKITTAAQITAGVL
ncbi:hypothetical protein [Xanthomonas campestris]|nr:hypothetical protein [Xanthomonas campestris]MCC3253314.1 hypothetical protein [Xanthomonas campestris pv. armoraciae]